jgi:hypothetical protein
MKLFLRLPNLHANDAPGTVKFFDHRRRSLPDVKRTGVAGVRKSRLRPFHISDEVKAAGKHFVLFARNSGGRFGKVVKEKLVMLLVALTIH